MSVTAAKLPVIGTMVAAVRVMRPTWRIFVYLIWVPLIVELLLNAAMFLSFPELLVGEESLPVGLLQIGVSLVAALIAVPAMTAWHRFVILGAGHAAARLRYSLAKEEWRYAGALLVIVVLATVLEIGVVAILPGQPPPPGSIEADIWAGLVTVAAIWPLARWLLVLPAIAVGEPLGGRDAERLGRGNQTRLWAVLMLAFVPFWIIDVILQALLVGTETKTVHWTEALAYAVLTSVNFYAALFVGGTAFSLCYRQLAQQRSTEAST
jgi:hypothetical protein